MLKVVLLFWMLTFSVLGSASEKVAQEWLEKMSHAMNALEYQGTVAFFKNGRLDTMKYFHAIDNGQDQERLLSLNSPMREVIREAGAVRCVFKGSTQSVVNNHPVSESFIVNLPGTFSDLNTIYSLSALGNESVAMRMAQVVSIQADDQYRYDRKIWIDKSHFLPLKLEVYDSAGTTLEQVVFTELLVNEDVDFIKSDSPTETIEKSDALSIDDASFIVDNIPAGFQIRFFTRMNDENTKQVVEHLLLTDGFSSISVYLEAIASDTREGLQTLGSVSSYTHIIDDFQITAMGEVPSAAVQFIAQGIKLR